MNYLQVTNSKNEVTSFRSNVFFITLFRFLKLKSSASKKNLWFDYIEKQDFFSIEFECEEGHISCQLEPKTELDNNDIKTFIKEIN